MKDNFQNIFHSLNAIDNEDTREIWCNWYARGIIGVGMSLWSGIPDNGCVKLKEMIQEELDARTATDVQGCVFTIRFCLEETEKRVLGLLAPNATTR